MIYFNNAASGWPKAPGVIQAISDSLQEFPTHPGRTINKSNDELTDCRIKLAKLLGSDNPEYIVLTNGATHSLNLALWGLALKNGERVITTITEHNSVLRPLNHINSNTGIDISYIGFDKSGLLDIEAFNKELSKGADYVIVNHASNVTGDTNDVKTLFSKAKESGAITILDASQSLGYIKFKVGEIKADIVAFTGHKALHGPPGTGGLYVAPNIELRQVFVGGTGVRSDLSLHPQYMPTRLEAGTQNIPAFAGLASTLEWHDKNGDNFNKKANHLTNILRQEMMKMPNVEIFCNNEFWQRTPVLSFRLKNWDVEETGIILSESFGIICRTGLHCAPLIHRSIGSFPDGTVRFSLSGFNTESEVDTALSAVRKITE
jgi:cysteine desulfurase / selenocysteine lyase